jgi:protoporphyrinogen oxidase
MLGVALARSLTAAGRSVTIFEAAPRIGGLTTAWTIDDLTWDRFYHVTLGSDASTRDLLGEVGLGDDLQLRATSTGYWDGARVHRAETARDFLRLPGLSMVSKLRIGATIAINARRRDWQRIERREVVDWLTAWSGRAATDRFWTPQLRAKLGDDHHDVAASLLWATFRRLETARRGASRREQMGYVRGGYARTIAAVERHLADIGVTVSTSSAISAVRSNAIGAEVVAGVGSLQFDDVIVTLAAPLAAELIADIDADAAMQLRTVRTMGVICASVVLDRRLSPHYLTYLAAPTPLTGIVDMSALVDADELGHRGLVYLPRYLASDHADFDTSDAELQSRWLPALAAVYPDATPGGIRAFAVARARHAFAVPSVGYSTRVPPLTTQNPRVHVVSSAHLVHATLNVDETIALGTWAGQELVARGRIDRDALLSRG